jgi:hypothetical protein
LGLRRRRGHAQDRRVDKECGAFGHGVPVAGKATKTAEIIEKVLVESAGALEPIDVGGKEVKIFEEIPAPAAARRRAGSRAATAGPETLRAGAISFWNPESRKRRYLPSGVRTPIQASRTC